MRDFTAGEAVRRISEAIGRPVDALIYNTALPAPDVIDRYAGEHKEPLPLGDIPAGCEVVAGEFWQREIARHDRRRLAYAVWTVLARRLLAVPADDSLSPFAQPELTTASISDTPRPS